MKRAFLRLAAATLIVTLLGGCATGAKHSEIAGGLPSLKGGQGRIYFYRPSILGAMVQPEIRLNGEVVGQAKSGGFFYVDRAAGNFQASATTEAERTLSFTLAPGETKYIRCSMSMGLVVGRLVMEPQAAGVGDAELASLSYTGAAATR